MSKTPSGLRGRIEFDAGDGTTIGESRIRLLEEIGRHGSIAKAAKAVPLAYKTAWDAVDAMNNLAEQPLVLRTIGGSGGGGSTLTDYGRRMIAVYRAIEGDYQASLDRLLGVDGSMGEATGEAAGEEGTGAGRAGHGDARQLHRLLHRLLLSTSARNVFAGRVAGLKEDAVDCEVRVALDDAAEIVAVITRDSAATMKLAIGVEMSALVKASSVILLTDPGVRTSARNGLTGEIERIHAGLVNAEVTLRIGGGKSLCAVITHDSVERLGLRPGQICRAIFKASAVILCQYP